MTTAHELLDLCRRHFDPHAEPIAQHAGHERTTVLRAATRRGEVIVKIHRDRERHDRERDAYRHWAPRLAERAPRLLTEIDDPPAVIITALPGIPIAELTLPPSVERDVFGQAGTILAAWHAAQQSHDTPNMTAWLATRGEQWLQLAEPILPAAKRAEIRGHLRELATLGPLPTVPCHLDFTPRNIVRAPDGTVGIIDFRSTGSCGASHLRSKAPNTGTAATARMSLNPNRCANSAGKRRKTTENSSLYIVLHTCSARPRIQLSHLAQLNRTYTRIATIPAVIPAGTALVGVACERLQAKALALSRQPGQLKGEAGRVGRGQFFGYQFCRVVSPVAEGGQAGGQILGTYGAQVVAGEFGQSVPALG